MVGGQNGHKFLVDRLSKIIDCLDRSSKHFNSSSNETDDGERRSDDDVAHDAARAMREFNSLLKSDSHLRNVFDRLRNVVVRECGKGTEYARLRDLARPIIEVHEVQAFAPHPNYSDHLKSTLSLANETEFLERPVSYLKKLSHVFAINTNSGEPNWELESEDYEILRAFQAECIRVADRLSPVRAVYDCGIGALVDQPGEEGKSQDWEPWFKGNGGLLSSFRDAIQTVKDHLHSPPPEAIIPTSDEKPSQDGHRADWWSLLPDDPDSLSEVVQVVERFYTAAQQELSLIPLVDELSDKEVDNLLTWLYRVGQWFPLGTATRRELLSDWANLCESSTIELDDGRRREWRRTPSARLESVLISLRGLQSLLPPSSPSTLIDVLNWLRKRTHRAAATLDNGTMREWSSLSSLNAPPFNGFLFKAHKGPVDHESAVDLMDCWSQWCDLRVSSRAIEKCLAHLHCDVSTQVFPYHENLEDLKNAFHPRAAAHRAVVVGWQIDDGLTRELRQKIRDRGELPRRWELEEYTPIRDIKDLREWLVRFRDECFAPDLSSGMFSPTPEDRLRSARAVMINVDRALLDWGYQNRPDSGTPADLHEAERMVNRMVDWLANADFQGSRENDDGGKADASLTSTITVHDLLKVLGDVDWCNEKARELGERSRASGAPLHGSLAAALSFNASHYQNEAIQHSKNIPKSREVGILRMVCKSVDKPFTKKSLETLLAQAALKAGRDWDEILGLTLSEASILLSSDSKSDEPQSVATPASPTVPNTEIWDGSWDRLRGWWKAVRHECGDVGLSIFQWRPTDDSQAVDSIDTAQFRDFLNGTVEWSGYSTGTRQIHLRSALTARAEDWERHYVLRSDHGLTSTFRAAFINTSRMLQSILGLHDVITEMMRRHLSDSILIREHEGMGAIALVVDIVLMFEAERRRIQQSGSQIKIFATQSLSESRVMLNVGQLSFGPMIERAIDILQRRLPHGVLVDQMPIGAVGIMSPMYEIDQPPDLGIDSLLPDPVVPIKSSPEDQVERSEVPANNGPPPVADWPPDDGWHFRAGEAAYARIVFEIRGKFHSVLKALAEARGGAVTWQSLNDVASPNADLNQDTVKGYVSKVRGILRSKFELPTTVDPIPNVEWGDRTSWKLVSERLQNNTKKTP